MAGSKRLVAITVSSSNAAGELLAVTGEILKGGEAAGADCEHFLICPAPAADPVAPHIRTVTSQDDVRSVLGMLSAADALVLALSASGAGCDGAFAEFAKAVYGCARWVSLAEELDSPGGDAQIALRGDAAAVRFPEPVTRPGAARPAVAVLYPGDTVADHNDPFRRDSFFAMEEAIRILGFTPCGRVLCTGLLDPRLEGNPLVKRQAEEIGRRLASETASAAAGL